MGFPSIIISPNLGFSTPARISAKVVFPEPLSPIIPTDSLSKIEKETSVKTGLLL